MTRTQSYECDALIVGAGMIGSACALALARRGLSVIVLDKQPIDRETQGEPQRVSAINHASENILRHLDVWAGIAVSRPQAFERIEVWDSKSAGTISFDAADVGLTHLGHIVSNDAISSTAHQALTSESSASLRFGETPVAITSSGSSIAVTLERGETIRAHLLIGADGANSKIRDLAGIAHQEAAYDHTAIVATVTPEQSHSSCARQRFLSSGPLAFLPLADNQCSIVWSAKTDKAEQLLALDENAFALELTNAFEGRLGNIPKVSARAKFPLVRRHATDYISERIALVGDAAHTVHPLAGLGANQGFADAAALAEVIGNAFSQNRDPASRSVLRRYERWRRGENALVLKVMDGFHGLFGTENPALAGLRGAGLNLTDRIPFIKKTFIRYAVGLEGDLPEMARIR
ncbi:MAG: UbiH/UbiF/VisC/COQ6 family ubiquinone biosynthesis hydroxylase [Arenicellales bacterium]|nr:UbiH/UbiF/VisC/COQ6 family ubiquinone biosynthesis hydroxylase [Arenicellales bacterium]MDP6919849.1 UbiH/UbiF/VisC/COQ6 family ubiquinone biosynthesis hydroxylase [Arenicellales bacterium]